MNANQTVSDQGKVDMWRYLKINNAVLAYTAAAAVTNGDATRVVAATRTSDALEQGLVGCA